MPDGNVMIVTGASSGIGRALAIAAARAGYRLTIVARRAAKLEETAAAIASAGGACTAVVADVRSSDAPSRIVEAAMRSFGRIDVLVNNAGGGAYGTLLEQSDAAIEAQWQQHVAAPLRLARAALPQLAQHGGVLVFIGSGLARVPLPGYGAYAPAKAAIRAAAVQLRRELRPRGIAVTYVDPGLVATEFHEAAGIERGTRVQAADPERVAQAILRGIARRAASVSGVPWQTAGTVLGEIAATLADPAITRLTPKPARPPTPPEQSHVTPEPQSRATPEQQSRVMPEQQPRVMPEQQSRVILSLSKDDSPPSFARALEPVARRMERVKLSQTFIREALVPGTPLELNELAMRWAGMPNKNERAALREVLDALTAAGYLEPTGEDTWKVVRAPD